MAITDNLQTDKKVIIDGTKHRGRKRTKPNWQKCLIKRFPILDWLHKYNGEWAANDLISGITLGLTIIPESIACALLAGLPTHFGLCSAFLGSFIYLLCGSIDNVIMGPTSLVALVSVQFTAGKPIEFAFILTCLSGLVQLIMGTLHMGFLFEFISLPLIKAFSSATAILVMESQLKVLLGIKYVAPGFVQSLGALIKRLPQTNHADLIMGVAAITFLIIFQNLEKFGQRLHVTKSTQTCLRYVCFARNTLIVLATAVVTYMWLSAKDTVPYHLSRNNLSGLPNFTVPQFYIEENERMKFTFWEVVKELNVAIVVIPIIGILTNISIGKLVPPGLVDTNQELLTVGLCNVVGSCVQAMPTSGAFSRYAISKACGLKTPMANLYSGIIVVLALNYVSVYFNFIPEATLAAILICSLFSLLDFKAPLHLWQHSKRDFLLWLLCFCACIMCGVEVGLFVSVIANVLCLVYLWARPQISVQQQEINGMSCTCVTPDNGIYFPAINHVRAKVLKAAKQTEYKIPVVIDCHKVNGLDFTAAQGLNQLAVNLSNNLGSSSSHNEATHGSVLLILYNLPLKLQKMIGNRENLILCEGAEHLNELLTQNSLRWGHLKV